MGNTWPGFMIALICLAPIIMVLLSFEFSMYLIQVKNTYFKKQKWFEKGLIVDILVIVLTAAVAGIVTGFGYGANQQEAAPELSIAGITLWWLCVALGITFMLTRIFLTKYINRKYKLDPSALLTMPVNKIAEFTKVTNYKEIAEKGELKPSRWKQLIDNDYTVLSELIKSLTNNVEKYQVNKLLADCVVFHERYVVTTSHKKRDYSTSLFLCLIETIQPVFAIAK